MKGPGSSGEDRNGECGMCDWRVCARVRVCTHACTYVVCVWHVLTDVSLIHAAPGSETPKGPFLLVVSFFSFAVDFKMHKFTHMYTLMRQNQRYEMPLILPLNPTPAVPPGSISATSPCAFPPFFLYLLRLKRGRAGSCKLGMLPKSD